MINQFFTNSTLNLGKLSTMRHFAIGALAAMALGVFGAHAARAEFILDFDQVGANVVATGSGTIDTADLTLSVTNDVLGGIFPAAGEWATGANQPGGSITEAYFGISGPNAFGIGGIPTRRR